MKKIFGFLVLVLSLVSFSSANAQIKFGLKGGLNVTNMTFSKDVFDASNKTGFFIGPMVKVSLPLGFSIDAAALYDQREANVNYKYAEVNKLFAGEVNDDLYYGEVSNANTAYEGRVNVKQKSINVPVNLRYAIGLSSLANVFFYAGPQWGFNIGDKDYTAQSNNIYSFKDSNFSVNLGLGTTLLKHLQLSANYNIACGKTADITFGKVAGNVAKAKSRNNSWQIALGYWF